MWVVVLVLAGGCLFRDAGEPRFFRPESEVLATATADPLPGIGVPVRLRPVRGTTFLRERIVWRVSPVEYGLYDQRRWSELPASYVQRALETALRDTPGVHLTDEVDVATLWVEVVAFDEVLSPTHEAVVSLVVSLRDRQRARLLDRTITAEAPIASQAAPATAAAMGKALDEAVGRVAATVGDAVRTSGELRGHESTGHAEEASAPRPR